MGIFNKTCFTNPRQQSITISSIIITPEIHQNTYKLLCTQSHYVEVVQGGVSNSRLLVQLLYNDFVCTLETVQDFLIKFDIKPLMHLFKISILSRNNDIFRLTKIMNNLVKDLRILSFKVIFSVSKISQIFLKKIFCEEYLIRRPTFFNKFF